MRRISILTPIIAVVAIAALLAGCTAPPAPTPVPPKAEATTIPTPAPRRLTFGSRSRRAAG